jgi:hypothetical protein
MDRDKFDYFLPKFRAASDEELKDALTRLDELAEEAAAAVQQVALEKGISVLAEQVTLPIAPVELTAEERTKRTEASTALWNSWTSKHVQYMFSAQALMFSVALLGQQGLRFGALWLLLLAALLCWFANRMGRQYTRSICADADRSIVHKHRTMKRVAIALWPALFISSFAGVALGSALRGA